MSLSNLSAHFVNKRQAQDVKLTVQRKGQSAGTYETEKESELI